MPILFIFIYFFQIYRLDLMLEQSFYIRYIYHKILDKKCYIHFFDTLCRLGNVGLSKLAKTFFLISRLWLTLEQNLSKQAIIRISDGADILICIRGLSA